MKQPKAILMLIAAFFYVTATQASASTFQLKSKVISVNTATNYLKLYHLNTQTDTMEDIKVNVGSATQFHGCDALRDLESNDEVVAELNYNEFYSDYAAIQITLIAKRGTRSLAVPVPVFQRPLVSIATPLFQNKIEEEPLPVVSKTVSSAKATN